MIRMRAVALLWLFFCVPSAYALRQGLLITQYSHVQWTTGAGLPADSINSIVQTKDGYIWLATSAGLCRFNGRHSFVFNTTNTPTLRTNSIIALLKDRNGTLWIGTEGGGLLNYDQCTFKTFTIDDGLSDNTILGLAQDGAGNLWILTTVDLSVYNGKNFSSAPVQHAISLFADHETILVGTETGLSVIQNGKVTHFPGNAVTAVYRNTKGQIWIGTRGSGLNRLQDGKIIPVLNCEEIRSILEDRDGNLWLGTVRGIRMFHKTSPLHPRIHNSVTALYEDREGSIWAGTSGEGLHVFRPSPFTMISADEGMATSRTWCVLQDHSGALWIGTDDGVSRWSDQQITNYHLPSAVKTLAEGPTGTIWAGTSAGVFRTSGESFAPAFPGINAAALAGQNDGSIWIGSADGLRRFSAGKLEQVATEEITSLFLDPQGQLWVGTRAGLKLLNNGDLQDTSVNDEVFCIQKDHDRNVWAGSSSNIYCIRKGMLSTYPIIEGAKDSLATGIAQDVRGFLWIGSRQGILRAGVQNRSLSRMLMGSGRGLSSSECSNGQPAVYASSDGRTIWIATVNGVAEIDAEHFQTNKIPPPVVIEGMERNRLAVANFRKPQLAFPSGASRIEFRYTALSYLPGVNYRYVLQGYDQFWTNAGAQTTAVYTNLPPGKYRFKVLAGLDDAWNIAGDSASFEIRGETLRPPPPSVLLPILAAIVGFTAGWFARRFILKMKS